LSSSNSRFHSSIEDFVASLIYGNIDVVFGDRLILNLTTYSFSFCPRELNAFLREKSKSFNIHELPVFRPEEFVSSKDEKLLLAKLKSEGKKGRIIAGGTGFYELARRGYIPEVKTVVSLMELNLSYVKSDSGRYIIGATTSLQNLFDSQLFGKKSGFEAIDDALREIRPVQVRNVATIGGEVCISVPIVDLPTALLACDASLRIISEKEERTLGLEEFYIDAFLTKLRYGEIVKEIIVPKPQKDRDSTIRASAFVKFGRTAYDFNLINCAAALTCELSTKKIKTIKIFLGGIKRIPIRANEVEERLENSIPEDNRILDLVRVSFSKTNLLPSVHGSNEYKHELLPIIVRDCVMKAYGRCFQDSLEGPL
jgi:carbon-monoxide dehydrogenase medium subunit